MRRAATFQSGLLNVNKFSPQRHSLPSLFTGFGVPVAIPVVAAKSLLGNLRSTTKETTTTSIDRARTGTRTSFSVGEMKVKKRSAGTTTTT